MPVIVPAFYLWLRIIRYDFVTDQIRYSLLNFSLKTN